jgi:hypothetical protein
MASFKCHWHDKETYSSVEEARWQAAWDFVNHGRIMSFYECMFEPGCYHLTKHPPRPTVRLRSPE